VPARPRAKLSVPDPSKPDPYADKLSHMLRQETGKSRKQKRTIKQLHQGLRQLRRVARIADCLLRRHETRSDCPASHRLGEDQRRHREPLPLVARAPQHRTRHEGPLALERVDLSRSLIARLRRPPGAPGPSRPSSRRRCWRTLLDLTDRADFVLDPFLGSGSPLISAENWPHLSRCRARSALCRRDRSS
jgi:hypothetical protein